MKDLAGINIVVLEARLWSELARLFEHYGGHVISAPALREVSLPARQDVRELIDAICARKVAAAVFLTGVGARAMISAAEDLGRKEEFLGALRETKVVCRGPKPVAVMRANDIPVALIPPEPYTSEALLASIESQSWDLRGKTVALQHYGETNAFLREGLGHMGARVLEISLYEWALPEDTGDLEDGIRAILDGRAHAIAFTTRVQVRHLMQVASKVGLEEPLTEALRSRVVVGSVGPVCTRELLDRGITPHVTPDHPKMGPLVQGMAAYFNHRSIPGRGEKASTTPEAGAQQQRS